MFPELYALHQQLENTACCTIISLQQQIANLYVSIGSRRDQVREEFLSVINHWIHHPLPQLLSWSLFFEFDPQLTKDIQRLEQQAQLSFESTSKTIPGKTTQSEEAQENFKAVGSKLQSEVFCFDLMIPLYLRVVIPEEQWNRPVSMVELASSRSLNAFIESLVLEFNQEDPQQRIPLPIPGQVRLSFKEASFCFQFTTLTKLKSFEKKGLKFWLEIQFVEGFGVQWSRKMFLEDTRVYSLSWTIPDTL